MKRCFKCSAVKPLSEFYKHSAMADGHLNKCKPCARDDVRGNRVANIERYRAYDRLRGNRQVGYAYGEKHPERRAAHVALGNAVRAGRVQPWPVCAIPDCDLEPEAHHTHYDDPLAVVWLCKSHHLSIHGELRRLAA